MPPTAYDDAVMLRGGRTPLWSPPLIYCDRPLGKPSPGDPRVYPYPGRLGEEEQDLDHKSERRRSWLKIHPIRPISGVSLVGSIPLWPSCSPGCPECERPLEATSPTGPFASGARMSRMTEIGDVQRIQSLNNSERVPSPKMEEKISSRDDRERVTSRNDMERILSRNKEERLSSHNEMKVARIRDVAKRRRSPDDEKRISSRGDKERGRSRGDRERVSSRVETGPGPARIRQRSTQPVDEERSTSRRGRERGTSGGDREQGSSSRGDSKRVSSRGKKLSMRPADGEQESSRNDGEPAPSRGRERQSRPELDSSRNDGEPAPSRGRERQSRPELDSSRNDGETAPSRGRERPSRPELDSSRNDGEPAPSRGDRERPARPERDSSRMDAKLVPPRGKERPTRPERDSSRMDGKLVPPRGKERPTRPERSPSHYDGEQLPFRSKENSTRLVAGIQSATQVSLTSASDLAALRLALQWDQSLDVSSLRKDAIKARMVSSLLDSYPEYSTTTRLDELRATEYAYLDNQDQVYLDYTGSGLAADAQHQAHKSRLARALCGNPQSANPTSDVATLLVDQARARILAHFNAPLDEYVVIFTQNATGAARLVGEAYPFSRRTRLVMSTDNHNSVNGLREYARRGRSQVAYVPAEPPCLRINPTLLISELLRRSAWEATLGPGKHMDGRRGLFAYPAQSNFSGVRHPLSWVGLAQQMGYDVLLDAAAYLPTGTIDLSVVQPEFLMVSWYKLFGYPTGVGCLVARRSALARLRRPWFSGGTIKGVAVGIPWHEMTPDERAFEDGTLNFLSIPDVSFGLDWLAYIGVDIIETRVRCLTGWFLDRLKRLEHSDGSRMIQIYGPTDTRSRGGIVCFNFLDIRGNVIDERIVAVESAEARISLRTGCFCNPGVAENALGLTAKRLRPLYWTKTDTVDDWIEAIGLPSGGAIRVSFGVASNAADVDRFFKFASEAYRDRVNTTVGLPPRDRC